MQSLMTRVLVMVLIASGLCQAQLPDQTLVTPPITNWTKPPATPEYVAPAPVWTSTPEQAEPLHRLQLRGSPILWWINQDDSPLPVLTTGNAGRGILGEPDTLVLLRAGEVHAPRPFLGADLGFHYWLDEEGQYGIDGRFFFLGKRSGGVTYSGNADGLPLLSIPVFDLNPALPGPSFTQIASPGASTGQVTFSNATRLWGFEVNGDLMAFSWYGLEISALIGGRYMELTETYSIVQTVTSVRQQPLLSFEGVGIPGADSLRITDDYHTRNHFLGANLVLFTRYKFNEYLAMDTVTRFALGASRRVLILSGFTDHLTPQGNGLTTVARANGGLFVQPSISRRESRLAGAGLGEADTRLVWTLSPQIELSIGYNLLYWPTVLRPASQISGTINTTTAPSQATFGGGGPLVPAPSFNLPSLIAHGLSFGLDVRF